MKNLFLFLFLLTLLSCSSDESTDLTDIQTTEFFSEGDVYDIMFNDLMLLDTVGIFRSFDFDMDRKTLRKIENGRTTTSELSSEKEDELIITTDLGKEALDFADIKYSFDENGLFFVSVESFLSSEEKATTLYGMLEKYFTKKHGQGTLAEDGFLDFTSKSKKYDYQISIKQINFPATAEKEGSYGFYLVYSMMAD